MITLAALNIYLLAGLYFRKFVDNRMGIICQEFLRIFQRSSTGVLSVEGEEGRGGKLKYDQRGITVTRHWRLHQLRLRP